MFSKILVFIVIISCTQAQFHDGLHYEHHAPKPYAFGYSVKDQHGEQHRQESGDGHSGVKGSYGFTDSRGVHRQVNYVADKAGFRAEVKTNEPGTANQDPAAVKIHSSAHPYFGAGYGLGGAAYFGGLAHHHHAVPVAPAVVPVHKVVPVAPVHNAKYGYGLGFGSVTGYDSRFGAY